MPEGKSRAPEHKVISVKDVAEKSTFERLEKSAREGSIINQLPVSLMPTLQMAPVAPQPAPSSSPPPAPPATTENGG